VRSDPAQLLADALPADVGHLDLRQRGRVGPEYIIPSVFNRRVAESVADAVASAAVASGVARRKRGAAAHEPATPLESLR
jgi:malic enzyme